MVKVRLAKFIAVVGVVALCAGALMSCSSGSSSSSAAASGAAATVNGVEIPESQVTATVESVRAQAGLDDADSWGTWLVANNMTAEQIRQEVIDSLVERALLKAGATDKGITVDSAEIDGYVSSMKSRFSTEEAWQTALTQAGFTEQEYRDTIEYSLLQQDLLDKFEADAQVTDEAILESANTYAQYYNGGKRSSHILFDADDAATAQEVLDRINSGELDFAEAAAQYSIDTSAQNGGDVGWDKATTFVSEYQDELDALEKGEISGLVESQFGIHIIKCTDVFDVEGDVTDINQVPEDLRESVIERTKYLTGVNDYQTWLQGLKDSATIETNEIPANVPYNIDLTKYEQAAAAAASEAAASAESDAASSDASASSDEAASSEESASSDSAASGDAAASSEAAASSGSAS